MKDAKAFLMFQGQAKEAIEQYQEWFHDLSLVNVAYMPDSTQVAMAELDLNGYRILMNDSTIKHNFDFTPSFSLFIVCDSKEEIERYAKVVADDGMTLMELNNYGFSELFTWVQDRFGISWQFTYNPFV
ncbi:VOC family protein [Rummeliibacillus pycnus]|uniref:VOC family protein n=1 Tax=Rummeliibacillus pycnus TaxID=101070 RepID=UPI000C9BA17D|nr:VOC family protein [Rummeliibacillus pycnus]